MEHMGGGSRLMAERQVICQGRLLSLKNKCWQRVIGSQQKVSFQSTEVNANRLLPTVNHGISIRSLMSLWVGQLKTAGPKSEEKPLQG